MRKSFALARILPFVCIFAPMQAEAIDAARYVIFPDNGQTMNTDQDHYSVTLLRGWISAKDSIFAHLFSQKKNGAFEISNKATFFDGSIAPVDQVFAIANLAANTNRPLAATLNVTSLPADAQTTLSVKVSLYQEDTIGNVIKTLEDSKAGLPKNALEAPWVGYATVVSNLMKQFFGTDATLTPITWSGDVELADVLSDPTTLREHYILLISPQKDQDTIFAGLDASKLTYDPKAQSLRYDNKPLQDWSYVMFYVSKAPSPDVAKVAFDSTAAWAVLARSQFFGFTPIQAKTAEDIQAAVNTSLTQLHNEIDLLIKENRFSKFDRAVGLTAFTDNTIDQVGTACKSISLTSDKCPTSSLDSFKRIIRKVFGLHDSTTDAQIQAGANKVRREILAHQAKH